MKRIFIDGTCIRAQKDGLSRYIINIVKCLALYHSSKNVKFTILVLPNQLSEEEERIIGSTISIKYLNIPPIGLKRDLLFTIYLYKNRKKFDFCYFPSNQYPLFYKGGIYTVHDIIYEDYPEQLGNLSLLKKIYLHINVRWGILFSNQVIAVSNYTKEQLIIHHKLSKKTIKKITTVYEGWEHLLEIDSTNKIKNLPFEKYFFYVGSSRGHKNLSRFIKAFSLISDTLPNHWGLIIAGNNKNLSFEDKQIINEVNKKKTCILTTGWISDEEMTEYFKKSSCFVFPSLSEGFGIPLLEAFHYEVPILCSNNKIFPEIAKDAAIYFNPIGENNMANTLYDFAINESKYSKLLIKKGKERLLNFSWEKATEEIFFIFENIN